MSQATFNAIFISDIHLGYGVTNTKKLFKFLKEVQTKRLFLVGDITHRECKDGNLELKEFLDILKSKNCEIIYIIGNHELSSPKLPKELENIEYYDKYIYNGIKNKIFVTHGHCYDSKDEFLRFLKNIDKRVQIKSRNSSFKRAIKKRLNKILKGLAKIFLHPSYRKYLVLKAIKNRCNTVVCGHFHKANSKELLGVKYFNCGDWIDNCSYVIEDLEGNLELKRF